MARWEVSRSQVVTKAGRKFHKNEMRFIEDSLSSSPSPKKQLGTWQLTYFSFSPLPGEMIQFDGSHGIVFRPGWLIQPPTRQSRLQET